MSTIVADHIASAILISFTKVQAETSYLSKELEELKRLIEKSEEKITNNFIHSKDQQSHINENKILNTENSKKIAELFSRYNDLREKLDEYQKVKNGNNH